MLYIILLILKIIGMILLILLSIILLVLLTILLVPIRYRVAIEHGDTFHMEGRASWLLHIINTKFTFHEGKPHIRIRIFGFILYDNSKPKVPKVKKQKKVIKRNAIKKNTVKKKVIKRNSKKTNKIKTNIVKKNAENKNELSNSMIKSASEHKNDKLLLNEHKSDTIRIVETHKQKVENGGRFIEKEIDIVPEITLKQKTSFLKKLFIKMKSWKEKISTFFIELKNKIIKWFEAAVNIKQKFRLITDFIKDELNREGFHITYYSLKKLLKHILPTKLKSRIIFGTGDPCTTGQALGFMGILYSFYGDKIQIIPDFENSRLEGKHDARGRIRLITIIIIVIKLMLDKRFKLLKRNFIILKEAL